MYDSILTDVESAGFFGWVCAIHLFVYDLEDGTHIRAAVPWQIEESFSDDLASLDPSTKVFIVLKHYISNPEKLSPNFTAAEEGTLFIIYAPHNGLTSRRIRSRQNS